ncbi:MAG: hypothetical protein GX638_15900 [Crenarchaeota archaeon]|nr:hypothetical protein [Thermoproteota archaeon]
MGKYDLLKEFLSLHKEDHILLTLRQIELIIGNKLPNSAFIHGAWWKDPASHSNVESWLTIGWKVSTHSKKGKIEWVEFKHDDK